MRMRDTQDEILEALRRLNRNIGDLDTSTNQPNDRLPRNMSSVRVVETSQMDFSNDLGAVTVQPGETETLVEWVDSDDQELLALGATDRPDSAYRLVSDTTTEFVTYSPLGLVNNPFSFKSQLGFTYPVGRTVQYQVTLSEQATEAQDYVARLFLGER